MIDDRLIRKTYSEIVTGHTITLYKNESVFIKHFCSVDLLEFDFKYDQCLKKCIAKGIPSEKEAIELLCKNDLWSPKKEEEIKNTKEMISLLDMNKRKHYSRKEIASFNDQIKQNQTYLVELLNERNKKVGATAEIFARKQADLEQIFKSFYYDGDLTQIVFPKDQTESIDQEEINFIFLLYHAALDSVSHTMIRLAALSREFQAMYEMAANLYEFYGRPISKLTRFQVDLARYAGYYKTILADEIRPPQEVMEDPDTLEDWYNGKTNLNNLVEKNSAGEDDGKTLSIVGLSKKDLDFYGMLT